MWTRLYSLRIPCSVISSSEQKSSEEAVALISIYPFLKRETKMIQKKTVLVLGAGASVPFGFPCGKQLVKKICTNVLKREGRCFKILENHGFEDDDIIRFRDCLARSGQISVDAFLQHRTDFIDVGKEAIAAALLPHELTNMLFDVPMVKSIPNWYELLFERLGTKFTEFGDNELAIITFNYDRSIEHYLCTALMNTHGKTEKECGTTLQHIPVVHLYGQLGRLPWQQKSLPLVPYDAGAGSSSYGLRIKNAAESIHIIHEYEDVEEDPNFKAAHKLLREAHRVYFLGFGFNALNVERLLPRDLRKRAGLQGTAYEVSPHQRVRVNALGMGAIMPHFKHPNTREPVWTAFPDKTIYDYLYHDHNAILD